MTTSNPATPNTTLTMYNTDFKNGAPVIIHESTSFYCEVTLSLTNKGVARVRTEMFAREIVNILSVDLKIDPMYDNESEKYVRQYLDNVLCMEQTPKEVLQMVLVSIGAL